MARLTSEITFTGSLGNLSAYRMRGVDKTIVRKKGGPTKKQIKNSPRFDLTRRNNAEFGGRATASGWIMRMMRDQKSLADYNIAGPLNKLVQHIQLLDAKNKKGERSILFSKRPEALEGFSLNKQTYFESVVRATLTTSINKDACSARVEIPALLPGINFNPPEQHSLYSVQVMLGAVPDLVYSPVKYQPGHTGFSVIGPAVVRTPWASTRKKSETVTLDVRLNALPPDNSFVLMLTIGVCYGSMLAPEIVEQTEKAGSAKVLRVV